jgi:hypothetical protein
MTKGDIASPSAQDEKESLYYKKNENIKNDYKLTRSQSASKRSF